MKIKIQPITSFLGAADTIEILNCNVVLGSYASISYRLTGAEGDALHHGHLNMPSQQYAQWGADDNFVAEFVANKLGATIVEIVPPYLGLPADPSAPPPQV